MKVEIEDVDEIIEKEVDSFRTSTRISLPKKYSGRKVKIVILKEDADPKKNKKKKAKKKENSFQEEKLEENIQERGESVR